MRLSPRLTAIAGMVRQGSRVADIGTDHAYIPVFLIETNKAQRAVASDINIGPLSKAREVIRQRRLEERIDTRLGNGLDVIESGEVDTVILAGMGGMLIRDILKAGQRVLEGVERLVLQPMNAQEIVREWLVHNGYAIVDEDLAREGDKIYQIIAAQPGSQQIDDPFYFEIGRLLIEKKHPLLPHLLNKKLKEYNSIITGLQGATKAGTARRLEEYKLKRGRLQGVMEQCGRKHT